MRRLTCASLFVVLLGALLSGCVIRPKTPEALAAAPPDRVHEVREVVSLPVNVAYRNVLRKARECWQQTSGIILTHSFFVEGEPYEEDLGLARVSLRVSGDVITSVVLTPEGDRATNVLARNVKVAGGLAHHIGYKDLPSMGAWARGEPVPCRDKLAF